jgi:hypothetical protein
MQSRRKHEKKMERLVHSPIHLVSTHVTFAFLYKPKTALRNRRFVDSDDSIERPANPFKSVTLMSFSPIPELNSAIGVDDRKPWRLPY